MLCWNQRRSVCAGYVGDPAQGAPSQVAFASWGVRVSHRWDESCKASRLEGPVVIDEKQQVTVLIPAKGLTQAKRRLEIDPAYRAALATSFLADAVAAASRASLVKEVVVLTPDPVLGSVVRSWGVTWLLDHVTGSLNAAVRAGVRRLRSPVGGVAVMVADLPALDPHELDQALGQMIDSDGGRLCVADHVGRGTTLLASREASTLTPMFGDGSASRHHDIGFSLATGALAGLRQDVDTLDDLRKAAALRSFGAATTRALLGALSRTGVTSAPDGIDAPRLVNHRAALSAGKLPEFLPVGHLQHSMAFDV